MADNVTLDAGSGGATLAAASLSISGDTAIVQMVGCGILSGSEGSWTHTQMAGGAGAVAAGVQRVTLASDDPAVTDLAAIEVLITAGNVDLAAIEVLLTAANVDHAANEVLLTTIDGKIPALGTAAMAASAPVTIASDDTLTAAANALLTTIDSDTNDIKTAVELLDNAVDGNYLNVNVNAAGTDLTMNAGVLTAQTQRVTIATDDEVNNLLGTIDADTGAIKTAVEGTLTVGSHAVTNAGTFATQIDGAALTALQLIDNPVFADDAAFTLTSSSAMVGGAIRDDSLSALAAVEGDVVPLRVGSTGALHVTGAGGGTQYNIDDAGGATDTGTLALAIRDDSLTTLTPVDGDYVGLRVSSTGALHVTGGGGGTEYTEDVASANPIVGTATLMERDDVIGTLTPVEGDWASFRCSAEGALWVQDFNSDALLADTNAMVVDLAAIETVLGTIDTDTGVIAGDTTSIDGKITACNTGAVVLSSGTVTTVSTVTNLSQLGGAAINMGEGAISTGTQRVTIATDDDGVAHLATIAGAVSTEMQVDVVAALPAGTNAIGKLAANSGVDIGDTDVTSVVPGTAATNLGKARASALGATDTGVAPLAVRNDDLADLAGADGDYTPLQVDPEGALYVNPAAAEPKRDSGVAAGGAPGTDTMIAAPGASIKIRVLALGLFATSATTNNVFIDNVDNDLLFNTGNPLPLSIDADGDTVAGFVLPYNPGGWFETDAANEAVTLNTSAAQDIAWSITWIEVPG